MVRIGACAEATARTPRTTAWDLFLERRTITLLITDNSYLPCTSSFTLSTTDCIIIV